MRSTRNNCHRSASARTLCANSSSAACAAALPVVPQLPIVHRRLPASLPEHPQNAQRSASVRRSYAIQSGIIGGGFAPVNSKVGRVFNPPIASADHSFTFHVSPFTGCSCFSPFTFHFSHAPFEAVSNAGVVVAETVVSRSAFAARRRGVCDSFGDARRVPLFVPRAAAAHSSAFHFAGGVPARNPKASPVLFAFSESSEPRRRVALRTARLSSIHFSRGAK